MRYREAHEVMVGRFPELAEPYRRLFDDWDNFEGEPPGQYIVFSDTLGTLLEIALELSPEVAGRRELLIRVLAFGEEMMASEDAAVVSLAIDAVTERLDVHPEATEEADSVRSGLL